MKKLVVLSGAGISAESGIKTFRDSNGLWESHNISEVASPEGWSKNPSLVLDFYNQRRKQLHEVKPNEAHFLLSELEKSFDVQIITQNVDDLHERAGSKKVLHLHGELLKSCSSLNKNLVYEQKNDIRIGDIAKDGSQLRPFIVWFGEEVPLMHDALKITSDADLFLVIGTSLQVYPAASLVHEINNSCRLFVINPKDTEFNYNKKTFLIKENATTGMKILFNELKNLS